MALPLITEDLSSPVSAGVKAGAARLLRQMLLDAIRAEHLPKERDHEREDPTHPS
jgi:hypothetical protein